MSVTGPILPAASVVDMVISSLVQHMEHTEEQCQEYRAGTNRLPAAVAFSADDLQRQARRGVGEALDDPLVGSRRPAADHLHDPQLARPARIAPRLGVRRGRPGGEQRASGSAVGIGLASTGWSTLVGVACQWRAHPDYPAAAR